MSDFNIIINDVITDSNISINDTVETVQVLIDDTSPNLNEFYNFINNFSTGLTTLTAKWQETADEMDNYVQPLTAKWIETSVEMDTLQEAPTGNWQDVYEYIETGVIDAGYF